jgi:hypothetical protein
LERPLRGTRSGVRAARRHEHHRGHPQVRRLSPPARPRGRRKVRQGAIVEMPRHPLARVHWEPADRCDGAARKAVHGSCSRIPAAVCNSGRGHGCKHHHRLAPGEGARRARGAKWRRNGWRCHERGRGLARCPRARPLGSDGFHHGRRRCHGFHNCGVGPAPPAHVVSPGAKVRHCGRRRRRRRRRRGCGRGCRHADCERPRRRLDVVGRKRWVAFSRCRDGTGNGTPQYIRYSKTVLHHGSPCP